MKTTTKNISKGWIDINLGVACNFERGIEPGADAYNSDGIGERFLRVVDVTESRSDPVYVDIRTTKKLKESDIALTLDGTVGAVKTGLSGIYSTGIRKVSFKNGANSNRLLYYILQSNTIQKIIDIYASGSTIKHASSAIPYLSTIVPTSPNEQKKIAEIFATIDSAIEKTDTLIEKYKRMKTGMMQDLFRYGMDKSGKIRSEKTHKFKDSLLGRIPVEWEVLPLQNIVTSVVDNRGKTPPNNIAGDVELIESSSISFVNRFPDYSMVTKYVSNNVFNSWFRDHPKTGDILISTVGEYSGSSAFMNEDRGTIAQNVVALRMELKDSRYFFYWTRHTDYWKQIRKVLMNQAQPSLKVPHLLKFIVKTPPFSEQIAIADKIFSADESAEREECYKQKLLSIKCGLMEDLLTGTVRVNHLVNK